MIEFPKCYVGSADKLQNPIKKQEHYNQFISQGFDDTETYTLYQTIAKFIVPRLKRYREINGTREENVNRKQVKSVSIILQPEEAVKIDNMIIAFSYIAEEGYPVASDAMFPICQDALVNFSQLFPTLWW